MRSHARVDSLARARLAQDRVHARVQVAVGQRLVVTPPDGPDFRLLFQGKHVFVSAADPEVSLLFSVDGDEPASEFVLEEHGAQSIARRVE